MRIKILGEAERDLVEETIGKCHTNFSGKTMKGR
jgi:hypothetical protein